MTIHAYTELRGPNPAYINISQRGVSAADVTVTVRATGENSASTIILDRTQAVALAHDILRHYRAPAQTSRSQSIASSGGPFRKRSAPIVASASTAARMISGTRIRPGRSVPTC